MFQFRVPPFWRLVKHADTRARWRCWPRTTERQRSFPSCSQYTVNKHSTDDEEKSRNPSLLVLPPLASVSGILHTRVGGGNPEEPEVRWPSLDKNSPEERVQRSWFPWSRPGAIRTCGQSARTSSHHDIPAYDASRHRSKTRSGTGLSGTFTQAKGSMALPEMCALDRPCWWASAPCDRDLRRSSAGHCPFNYIKITTICRRRKRE